MTIEPFGKIEFSWRHKEWFGLVANICPKNKVELTISVQTKDQDLTYKIRLVRQFAKDYDSIITDLHNLVFNKYKDTRFEVSREEIEQMYFLTGIDMKEDNKTWWLTLEPHFNVASVYNHFLRFTMIDRKIVWANFDINPKAQ
jgi:hypothetical protein